MNFTSLVSVFPLSICMIWSSSITICLSWIFIPQQTYSAFPYIKENVKIFCKWSCKTAKEDICWKSVPHCPASGGCATHSVYLACSARLRVAGQLFRLRDTTPWQAAAAGFTLATPISAPVCAYGLPGRKKGNQISLVAFVKPGGRSRTRIYDLHDVNVTL